ncbi:hypothetical protein VCHA38O209_40351 [Vibrio chagasii]|nr:hypothetical protein VCHA35O135_150089 [Vibrio chagasii]CAK2276303.1 hypothetical protein VCRA2112O114_150094 [Vibrio crassostreae]CAH6908587.1 hypothetical protein VCHA28FP16_20416 [Vibrio chagasii]CAH6932939.1 hypothetical protein VCHA31O71_30349 [Vibrio chagasii]CAH6964236.1 hypothetical protein VCHA35P150_30354 [Vibrio chagasii]
MYSFTDTSLVFLLIAYSPLIIPSGIKSEVRTTKRPRKTNLLCHDTIMELFDGYHAKTNRRRTKAS